VWVGGGGGGGGGGGAKPPTPQAGNLEPKKKRQKRGISEKTRGCKASEKERKKTIPEKKLFPPGGSGGISR